MRVSASNLSLASSRTFQAQYQRTQSLSVWNGAQVRSAAKPQAPAVPAPTPARTTDTAEISDQGKTLLSEPDAQQRHVLEILKKLFGITSVTSMSLEIQTSHLQASGGSVEQSGQQTGSGLSYDYHESYAELEQSSLTAQGTITLDDGRSFKLDLAWQQTRAYTSEKSVSIRAGDAQATDPLALDLTGGGVDFLDQLAPMDLSGDGTASLVHRLAGNAKWLVFDKNQDGKVTQDELFGPRSGDGFGELAQLDDDGNGWVDGGDGAFGSLSLWDGVGAPALLASYGVGALSTGSIAAAFDHKDATNALVAKSRAAGLYLRNDGSAGVTRQVDLVA